MKQINRRDFLNRSAAGLAAGAMLAGTNAFAENEEKRKPNVLFIMTDQQHARMMSCAGNEWLKTPALDAMAEDGIRFENAYSANPVCVPSRTSMATGVMSCRLGADGNQTGMSIKQLPSEVDENSMGKLMKQVGYDTFYGGKVHMCGPLAPQNAGYDEFCKDSRGELPDDCVEFIKKDRDKPFFAVASFINPHDICFAHSARIGKSSNVADLYREAAAMPLDELPPLPDNYEIQENEPSAVQDKLSTTATTPTLTMRAEYAERDWRINRWIYQRLTERVDGEIGRILDGLKEAGLEDDTLIIFTSDHGNMDASHHLASKGLFYEESVGVPFLMKYKGVIPPGQADNEHFVSTGLDILPTICDYAGIDIPEHLLGKSLRSTAEGEHVDDWRTYVASENTTTRMIRSRSYKYCSFSDPDSKEMLVDMEKDPGEMRNLVDDPVFREVLLDHRRLLAEWSELSDDKDASKYLRKG
jgi:arylsulfatase A-like enzyme